MKTNIIEKRYLSKVLSLEYRTYEIQNRITSITKWQKTYTCESLLSDLWQLWSNFNRTVIIESCNGVEHQSGVRYAGRHADNTWQRIGYEANCAARQFAVDPNRKNRSLRQEPTWGDIDKIIDIVNLTSPANRNHLITCYGLGLQGPKYLQITRNACFHKHKENVNDVINLLLNYSGTTSFSTPVDIIWYIDTLKNTNAIYSWIDDIKTYIKNICS